MIGLSSLVGVNCESASGFESSFWRPQLTVMAVHIDFFPLSDFVQTRMVSMDHFHECTAFVEILIMTSQEAQIIKLPLPTTFF
jgi:hypothetical protein